MEMKLMLVKINDIIIKNRIREDMGNMVELTNSIKEFGLFSPILINYKNILIAGRRRLEACRQLGLNVIQALVVDVDEEIARFNIESQENLCRKSLTPAELDKEIEMKKKYAYIQFHQPNILVKIWRGIRSLFKGKN